MTSVNKRKKGVDSYIGDLGLKSGCRKLKRVQFYNASQRKALKRELRRNEDEKD